MLSVCQHIGRHASYDLYRKDATVSCSFISCIPFHCLIISFTTNLTVIRLRHLSAPLFSVPLPTPLTVHLVDVWNMIEAFRDNGLSTLDHNAEINVSRLETILSSIFYQLNKRLPTTHQINVEQSIGLLLNFMVATYDRCEMACGNSVPGPCGGPSVILKRFYFIALWIWDMIIIKCIHKE